MQNRPSQRGTFVSWSFPHFAALLVFSLIGIAAAGAHDLIAERSQGHFVERLNPWAGDPLPGLVRQLAPTMPHPTELPMVLARDLDRAASETPSVRGAQAAPIAVATFAPFAPEVKTRWDDRWLYVESNGMPDHRLMVGITAWQQQVAIPQRYLGDNAWQIPLHPVVAKSPLSAKSHFFRGAIALAANGVPIFNPIKNDGKTDTFVAGELDEFGGHCGRGDDYHYHIAPLHLEPKVGKGMPIAYALDGYAIYGLTEPDGTQVGKLDEFNGHADGKGNYHYHSTKTYPYLNGGFHGEVTDRGGQVDPQPHAASVRPATTPLRGATITNFTTTKPNAYRLEYKIAGETRAIKYELLADNSWRFEFVDGKGRANIETYPAQARDGGNRRRQEASAANPADAPPSGDGPPPAGDRPRRPDGAGGNADRQGGDERRGPDDGRGRGDRDRRPPGQEGERRPRPDADGGGRGPGDRQQRPPRQNDIPTTPPVMLTPAHTGNFKLSSPVVADGGPLPTEFTGDGAGATLPLEWKGAPANAKSFAIVMDHLAPDGMKCYWTMWAIPAEVTSLPKNVKGVGKLGATWKRGETYIPPHSQGPGKKAYTLTAYALSAAPKLDQPASEVTRDVLLTAIKDLIVDSAPLNVTYTAPTGDRKVDARPEKPQEEIAAADPPKPAPGGKKKKAPTPGVIKPSMADTIKVNVYADNWFILYINGKLVAVDPIDFLPHNVVTIDILPDYPMTIAVMAKDNADPKTGMEYGNHIGDGGFIIKFADGTVSDAKWKAEKFFWGPLNHDAEHPKVEYRPIPENWFAVDFDDSKWTAAKEFTEAEVDPKEPYFKADFKGAKFIWTGDLDLDNTVIFRTRVEKPDWKKRWNTKPDLDISGAPSK